MRVQTFGRKSPPKDGLRLLGIDVNCWMVDPPKPHKLGKLRRRIVGCSLNFNEGTCSTRAIALSTYMSVVQCSMHDNLLKTEEVHSAHTGKLICGQSVEDGLVANKVRNYVPSSGQVCHYG